MTTIRTASGRLLRTPGLHETPLPIPHPAALFPGGRVLGVDGQIYESLKDPDSGLYEWKQRAQGEPGPAIEIQKTTTEIQWRVAGGDNPWTTIITLGEITGPAGETGPPGAGLSFQGSVPTAADLPDTSTTGFAYLTKDTGDIWAFDGTIWVNAGPAVQGPPGDKGDPGDQGLPGAAVELRKTLSDLEWRLVGQPTWTVLVSLDDIRGPVGDNGPPGPAGPGFSFQGKVPTTADLPMPSTQGFGYEVEATGDLYIYNGSAWVNAGPLQGPKGDQGEQGPLGPTGPGFSYQGNVPTVGDLPTPAIQGHAYRVGTDLYIYNGTEWVNAGTLQGPKGDQGEQGPIGPAGSGFSFQGSVPTVDDLPLPATNGHGYKVEATGDLYVYNGIAWVNAGPLQGADGPGFLFKGILPEGTILPLPAEQGWAYRIGLNLWIYDGSTWVDAGQLAVMSSTGINLQMADGAIDNLSLYFVNDTDSGFYRISENKMGWVTGGSLRLVIDDGQVPIKEVINGTEVPFVTSQDIGTGANEIPLNSMLGALAFLDDLPRLRPSASAPQENQDINFEYVTDTSIRIRMRGLDGVVRSTTLTLS